MVVKPPELVWDFIADAAAKLLTGMPPETLSKNAGAFPIRMLAGQALDHSPSHGSKPAQQERRELFQNHQFIAKKNAMPMTPGKKPRNVIGIATNRARLSARSGLRTPR